MLFGESIYNCAIRDGNVRLETLLGLKAAVMCLSFLTGNHGIGTSVWGRYCG